MQPRLASRPSLVTALRCSGVALGLGWAAGCSGDVRDDHAANQAGAGRATTRAASADSLLDATTADAGESAGERDGSGGSAETSDTEVAGGASAGASGAGSGEPSSVGAGGESPVTTGATRSGPVSMPANGRERAGVVNLVDAAAAAALEAFLDLRGSQEEIADALAKVTNTFLETYVEQYDFVYLVADHDLDVTAAGRFAPITRAALPGTGLDYDTETEGYKTNGRLRAVIGVNYSDYFGPFGHELLHYWANLLDPDFGFGESLEGNYSSHWAYTGMKGVLGGFDPATLRCETAAGATPLDCMTEANGRYRYRVQPFGKGGNSGPKVTYSPLELYLMGLIPLSEVPSPILVLEEASDVSGSYDETTNTVAVEAKGVRSVRTAELVEKHGLVRELPETERAFTAAFVVVSATPASDAVLDHVGDWAAIFGNRAASSELLSFEALTGGRATLDTELGPRRDAGDPPLRVRIPKSCDLVAQDCGADKACYFYADRTYCGLTSGGVRDEPCRADTDCAPGLACSRSDTGGSSACEPYCSTASEDPDGDSEVCSDVCGWWILTNADGLDVGGLCRAP